MTVAPGTQYDRYLRLIVAPVTGGEGIDFSAFRVYFKVTSPIISTPNAAYVRIYNLAKSTVDKLRSYNPSVADPLASGSAVQSAVKGQLIIEAGYINAQKGVIFQGDIVQVRAGRISQVDTYTDVYARDGDLAHVWGLVNGSLAAGWTPKDFAQKAGESMNKYGVTDGALPASVNQNPAPRGKVMFGMTRNYLDAFAATHEMTWSIDKGQIVYIPYKDFRKTQAIRLDSRSGLIGMPQLTESGVTGRCLLNPAIGIGTRLQIANNDIQLPSYDQQWTAINFLPGRDALASGADGYFKVLQADHTGDTRGNDWYTTFTCISLDSTQVPMQVVGMGIPP